MKIAVAGIGYVGLSNAVLLSQKNEVVIVDVVKEKVDFINAKKSPLKDREIENYLSTKNLNLQATMDWATAYKDADYVIVATPTNYDSEKNYFDTSMVDGVIRQAMSVNSRAIVVIKSTIPIGYTIGIQNKLKTNNIIFSPEFLREGKALYDNLYPSRIILGLSSEDWRVLERVRTFGNLLQEAAVKKNIPLLFMKATEAEAVKLFSNTYLAMRVSFFNELDTFAEMRGLNTQNIVDGVCCDPRIGNYYNNPSFGYGGYCLPKDTKQLLANYHHIPNNIISAVVAANDTRKNFIVNQILEKVENMFGQSKDSCVIGVYRLSMKTGADNFRQSSVIEVIKGLIDRGAEIVIYEPMLSEELVGTRMIHSLDEFKKISQIIIANRYHFDLESVKEKVYTRDLYLQD